MAKTLQAPVVAVDLKGVVQSAIDNAQAVRRLRAIEIETTFQQQVADGLSYDAQVNFLESQLEKERSSSLSSTDIIKELETRVSNTKRLKRFAAYRSRYQDILTELKGGRANAKEQLSQLKGLLGSAGEDEELKVEIQGDITAMEQEVKTAEDTMVQNQLKRAQYDGTEKVLTEAIELVKSKRSSALFEGLDDEASAYDTWLTVLNKQLSETRVVNAVNDIDVRVNTKGLNAVGKVDELNQLIRKSDGNAPITIDGVTYDSAKEYFTNTRDAYLAGTGSGIFSDFFKEIDGEYQEQINAAIKRDGLVTTVVFDRIQSDFSDIKSRGEFKPFLERVENYESLVQGTALSSTAQSIIDRVAITGDYQGADKALQSYASKYNVNVDSYRLALSAQAEQKAISLYEASDGTISLQDARQRLGVDTILTPEDKGFATPGAATVPAKPGAATPEAERALAGETSRFAGAVGYGGTSIVDFLAMAGQDSSRAARAALAAERGIKNYTGSAQQNMQLLNMLREEAVTPPAPKEEITPAKTGIETPQAGGGGKTPAGQTPAQPNKNTPASTPTKTTPTTPAAPAPKPTVAPEKTPTKPTSSYQGASIVDFLKSQGQDSSQATRAKLAAENGIVGYDYSAEKNTELLKKLRGY